MRSRKKLLDRLEVLQKKIDQNKDLYQERRKIISELADDGFLQAIRKNSMITLVDHFSPSDTYMKPIFIDRYDVLITKGRKK